MSGASLWTPIIVAAVSLRCLLTQAAAADGAWVLWFAQGSLSRHGVLGTRPKTSRPSPPSRRRASARRL